MKSQVHYYHATYYLRSYIVNSICAHFAVTESHLQISHQPSLKQENFTAVAKF